MRMRTGVSALLACVVVLAGSGAGATHGPVTEAYVAGGDGLGDLPVQAELVCATNAGGACFDVAGHSSVAISVDDDRTDPVGGCVQLDTGSGFQPFCTLFCDTTIVAVDGVDRIAVVLDGAVFGLTLPTVGFTDNCVDVDAATSGTITATFA